MREAIRKVGDKLAKRTKINELVDMTLESPTVVAIHVNSDKKYPQTKTLRQFLDGMQKLAQELETNPKLAQVEEILGYSWIVSERPDILPRFGFSSDYEAHPLKSRMERRFKLIEHVSHFSGQGKRHTEHGLARISKSDFLARYGSEK